MFTHLSWGDLMDANVKPIAVLGLGYVGLPLSLCYSIKQNKVYGIDISEALVNDLKAGRTDMLENYNGKPIVQILKECLSKGDFVPVNDPVEALKICDKFILTVGIPVKDGKLDYEPLKDACITLSKGLKKGDAVMVRSTVPPGTTEEVITPILEKSKLKAGEDFYLIYCPERISEGNAFDEFENIPVVISGINDESVKLGTKIIKMISNMEPIPVSSIKTAETAKVIENVQRDVNIAMVQQFAGVCRNLDVDVFELIKAVNTHPRVNLLRSGPGVGGYCIPNALYYLKPKAEEMGLDIDLLELARKINSKVPAMIAEGIKVLLNLKGKQLEKSKVAILGVAMKDYCGDARQSPVFTIIRELKKMGISVSAFDSCVSGNYEAKASELEQCLDKSDCLLITAVQKDIDYNKFEYFSSLMNNEPVIFDTRNIVESKKAQEYGFEVLKI